MATLGRTGLGLWDPGHWKDDGALSESRSYQKVLQYSYFSYDNGFNAFIKTGFI